MILGRRGRLFGGARKSAFVREQEGGFTGLLDDYPGAAAAYSLRLLRSDYSGGLVRVMAWNGLASQGEADIMPYKVGDDYVVDLNSTLENLDAIAIVRGLTTSDTLADLVLTGTSNYDGLTPTWYDQDLLGNNATQASAAAMPVLITGGAINLENGKPCFTKTTAQSFDLTSDIDLRNIDSSQIYVYKKVTSGLNDAVGWFNGSTSWSFLDYDYSGLFAYGAANNITKGAPFRNNISQKLIFGRCENAVEISIYEDSTLVGSISSIDMTRIRLNEIFGGITNSAFTFQESIIYPTDLNANRTAIETNINNFYNIYP